MRLVLKEVFDREICHFATSRLRITNRSNTVFVTRDDAEFEVALPEGGWQRVFGASRLARRALRLDKCNVVPVRDGFVIIRQGQVYRYDERTKELQRVLRLKGCRNVLHQSIAVLGGTELFFGEYGSNRLRGAVPVYRSVDAGCTWAQVFEFPPGKIAHVHGCYWDPFEQKLWVFTGDFENECQILCTDRSFTSVERIGDGSQTFRACNAFFEADSVHWIMDSQLQDSYHIRLDRKSRTIERRQLFPGPVWYVKRLDDGYYLAATTQEIGPGVKDRYAHLMVSKDLETWDDVHQFEHDGLPKKVFKFGVLGFPDGRETSRSFHLFGEALRGLDGKVALCEIR